MEIEIIEKIQEIDLGPIYEYINENKNEPPFEFNFPLKKKRTHPYPVGQREYSKSPGSRTYTERWYDPQTGQYSWHQGADFLHRPEFWQEVEMCSGPNSTVQDLRDLMGHLSGEEVARGYEHYYDLWNWEDNSERNRRLMEAFEAEHTAPKGTRIFDKVEAHAVTSAILAKYREFKNELNIIIEPQLSMG